MDAKELLERLRREDPEPAEMFEWGDPIMLEPYYSDRSEADVSAAFGGDFAEALLALPVEPGKGRSVRATVSIWSRSIDA